MEFKPKSFDFKYHSRKSQCPSCENNLELFHLLSHWSGIETTLPFMSWAYEYPGSLRWEHTNGMDWMALLSYITVSDKCHSDELHVTWICKNSTTSTGHSKAVGQATFLGADIFWLIWISEDSWLGWVEVSLCSMSSFWFYMVSHCNSSTVALPSEAQIRSHSWFSCSFLSVSVVLLFNPPFLLSGFFE